MKIILIVVGLIIIAGFMAQRMNKPTKVYREIYHDKKFMRTPTGKVPIEFRDDGVYINGTFAGNRVK